MHSRTKKDSVSISENKNLGTKDVLRNNLVILEEDSRREMKKTKGEKEHKLNELLDNIKKLLEVFKILRGKYEDDYEKFEYELSYRDAAQVFDAYAVNNNFKKSVRDALVSDADSVV